MKIKIERRHENAVIPKHATAGSAGMDLVAVSKDEELYYTSYDTGIAVAIPTGYVGLVFPRSSISKLPNMSLANAVGVIDSDYRGTIQLRFRGSKYEVGERVGQLVVMPYAQTEFEEDYLEDTDRGAGGFGSTSD